MNRSDKLNTKNLLKHLKYLMPQYLKNLENPVEDQSEDPLSVFTDDELLIQYFFSTPFAHTHLDYDFFCMAIQDVIGYGKVYDPVKIVQELLTFVNRSANYYQWIAVIPMRFESVVGIVGGGVITKTQKFGRFSLLKPAANLSEFHNALDDLYNVAPPLEQAYGHQLTQGLNQTRILPYLTFEVGGTVDARNWSTKRKLSYFCSLAEVFCVNGKAIGTQGDGRQNQKAFFPNIQTGEIGRVRLDRDVSMNIEISEDFLDYLHSNEFGCFADMIFTTEDSLFARLRSALFFFSKGFNGKDRVLSFICYVVAIEALFTGVGNSRIAENLSVCISSLCYQAKDRTRVEADIKEIYKQRSAIMHHGIFDLRDGKIDQARDIAAKAIFHTFKLHKHLSEQGVRGLAKGDMAQRFAAHIKQCFPDNQHSSTEQPR